MSKRRPHRLLTREEAAPLFAAGRLRAAYLSETLPPQRSPEIEIVRVQLTRTFSQLYRVFRDDSWKRR